jgi:nucleotide-binding universal stress UspA family protein
MRSKAQKNKRVAGGSNTPSREDFHLERILVPIDFSEHSKNALYYAASFSRTFDAELLLVFVVEETVYPTDFGFGQVIPPSLERELYERGTRELDKLLHSPRVEGCRARSIVRTGKPFIEIISAAEEERADLIIIATHGHTGVEHLLFGSTAEKVVRKAPCPVLVVRAKG